MFNINCSHFIHQFCQYCVDEMRYLCITVQLWVTQITHAIRREYSHLLVLIYAFLNSAVVRELFSKATVVRELFSKAENYSLFSIATLRDKIYRDTYRIAEPNIVIYCDIVFFAIPTSNHYDNLCSFMREKRIIKDMILSNVLI